MGVIKEQKKFIKEQKTGKVLSHEIGATIHFGKPDTRDNSINIP